MKFNEYQFKANSTAIYPNQGSNFAYTLFGFLGEAGEIANKYKKILRDHNGVMSAEQKADICQEIGDCLWYIAAMATELRFNLGTIANNNLEKLLSRKSSGTLHGSGDNR